MLVNRQNYKMQFNRWLSGAKVAFSLNYVTHLFSTLLKNKSKQVLAALLMLPLSAMANIDWVVNNDDTGISVPAGSNITYNVTVANNGSDPAPGTTLTLAIDPATTFVSATGLACSGTGPVTCTVPPLAAAGNAGDEVSVVVVVNTSTLASPVTLGASVPTAGEVGGLPGNNVANEPTPVSAGADVRLVITGPATAQSGSSVTYIYTATNLGPSPSTGSVLSIPKPTGLDNITTPAGCTLGGSTYTCNIGALAVNGTSAINFTGQISAASPSTVSPQGTIVASGATPDPVAVNNANTFNTSVSAGSDLRILKSSAPSGGSRLTGTAVTFTLTPSYTGDVPGAMTITDTIPSNYTIGAVASPQNGWTCGVAGQVVTCTRPTGTVAGFNVALGAISIPTTAATAGAGIVNTTTITGPVGQDPNAANNTASSPAMTLVDPTVDLRANKTGPSSPALVVVGSSYAYNISTTNIGSSIFFGTARMVDDLPAGLTVDSYTLNGWTCLPAAPVVGPATITCERIYTAGSNLGVNITTPVVTLNTTVTGTGTISNGLTVSSPDPNIADLNPVNDTITYNVDSAAAAAAADIAVVKTIHHPGAPPNAVASGEYITYKLEVVNFGPVTSNNVTLSDALQTLINSNVGPTGAGFIDAVIQPGGTATGGNCTSVASGGNGRNLSCTFATVPQCTNGVDCTVVLVSVRPGGNATVNRVNTASVISSTTHDPNLSNNSESETSTVTARADVTVTKVGPASVPAGQNLTYVITAQNVANGMSSADNVTIVDTLPDNLIFLSVAPSSGSCGTTPTANSTTGAGNNTINCNLGTIANGAQQTVTVVVRPRTALGGTTITNVVDVTTTTPELAIVDGGLTNHAERPTNITVPVVGLFIDKVDNVDPVAVGDNVIYTIQVTNSGLSAAENVTVTDTLPTTNLNYISHTVPVGGSCGLVGNILTCSVPYLAAGAVTNFTVTMQGIAKGVDNNVATVTSNEILAGNGTADNSGGGETTTVRTKADMEVVSKTPSAATVNLNQPFNFVIRVRNNGPNEADDVVVSDTLPAGMQLTGAPVATVNSGTIVPAVPAACTGVAGGSALTCNLGTVNLAAVVDISVPVRVVSAGGVFNNTASVLTSSLDTNGGSNPIGGNNFKTVPVTVNKSSLAGVVYRDVNDDGAQLGAGETGIVGVQMQLTGTDTYGNAITRTATTIAGGAYLFDNLPQSNGAGYTVTEVSQPTGFTDGIETAGTSGGTPGADHTTDIISGIVLAANTAATGYLFGEIPPVTVSGTVFNDTNGLNDTFVNGTGTNAGSATLTAYLVQGGLVVASSPVAANGTFSFSAAQGSGYTVVLLNTAGIAIGAGAPVPSLPAGWVNTGENNDLPTAAGSDGTINGVSAPFTVALVDVPNRNLGIEQPPTSGTAIYTGQPNPLGTITVPVGAGAFTGVLPVGVTGTNAADTAAVTNIRITAFPTNVTSITINGVTYTSGTFPVGGVTVTVAQLAGMAVDPIDGAITVDIPYVAIDAAGRESPVGHVQLPFGQITLAGNVFNDVNGSKVKDVAEAPLQLGLNAVLTDASGTVVAVTPILADGTYLFNVAPNATYGVTVTTANPAIGATAVTVTLPAGGWVTTGESLAAVAEATPDSRQTVNVLLAPVINVNFGLSLATAAVSGNVWRDIDHNRALGVGETAVQGITVELLNAAGTAVVKTTVTDASGHYAMTGLAPGDYTIRFRDGATGGIILGSPTFDDQLANTLPGAGTGATPNGSSVLDAIGQTLKVSLIANQELQKQSLPFDPSGVVYNSITREPVPGATVTLLSGGVAVPPGCLIGNQNAQVTGPFGTYQYLLIRPVPVGCPGSGAYTIQVQQPSGYLPPNAVQGNVSLPGGTYTPTAGVGVDAIQPQSTPPAIPVTGVATIYYFDFNFDLVGGRGVVNNHIPLDPVLSNSFIVTKTGNKSIAEIGDVVTYTVKARMTQGLALSTFDLVDNLPAGFRYIPGTATQSTGGAAQATLADPLPAGNLGPQLTFKPTFAAQVTDATITYKVRVGVGAMQGDGINRVQGRSPFATSNTAQYKVKVTGGVFTNDACVAGKVFVDCNNNHIQDAEELGIPGVRMYMEDGTYFISDVEGKYSYCGISPKTHVLKVDSLTMPRGSRLTTTSNRNAGDANSLFLDTKNGELIRADFAEGSCSNTVLEQVKARRTGGEVRAPETEKKAGPAIKFEGKSPAYPQQGTDSANQRLVKPRGGAGDAPVSNTVNDDPVQPLPESSGNTRGDNLRDQKGDAK